MKRTKIDRLLKNASPLDNVLINGWLRTKRDAKNFSFLEINDGSCLKNIQVIADNSLDAYAEITKLTIGSALAVKGRLVKSQGKGQALEIQAQSIDITGLAQESYPLQKKRHSDKFLRTIAHLRPRTNKYGALYRIRSELSHAIHKFFRDKGFHYIHTPIITGSDCEGAGEMFRVTTLNQDQKIKNGYAEDFFKQEAHLTVSGQLSAEMFALALGDVYTFGPTFRAENSNTSRHAAEFWMVEPEMAFCDLEGAMDLAEEMIKFLITHILNNCADDIQLFAKFVDKKLMAALENITGSAFLRLPYRDAVDILKQSEKKFEYKVDFGSDLKSEHERYLTEEYFNKPLIIYNYPKNIKPFYMRLNDDGLTVAAMDVLAPGIGEIIGGSQREERPEALTERMKEQGLSIEDYWWYIDSRKYGTAPHSGFGLGFERTLMLLTGVKNIRDVIPFPRTPGSIDF